MNRKFEISPAYDKRPEYGQHCVDMRWVLQGQEGSVQFVLYTGWYPNIIPTPETPWQQLSVKRDMDPLDRPMPADLGYHSRVPMYEGQSRSQEMCSELDPPGPCYYDGSTLNADRIFSILVHQGGEAVWKALEEYYVETFVAKKAESQ